MGSGRDVLLAAGAQARRHERKSSHLDSCLKFSLHNFFLVKKGALKANQAGKYSLFSHWYLFFPIFSFKHNYRKKRLLSWVLPIIMNRENKIKKLETGFCI